MLCPNWGSGEIDINYPGLNKDLKKINKIVEKIFEEQSSCKDSLEGN